jgi:hypothetical protein
MNGRGVQIIRDIAIAAALPKPHIIEGPGYKKLAHAVDNGEQALEWEFLDLPHTVATAEPVLLHTLTGFADYITANRDERPLTECAVVVADHTRAALVSKEYGEIKQRDVYVVTRFDDLIIRANAPGMPNVGSPFAFGSWMAVDAMNIALQSLFAPNDDRARVLEIVGNVRTEGVTTWDDDGVTQGVVASAGVKIGKLVGVPNPVKLAPYRTFRELDQPESLFVLRMRGEPGDLPQVALFEADGGAWKIQAIERIAAFLRPILPADLVVVA